MIEEFSAQPIAEIPERDEEKKRRREPLEMRPIADVDERRADVDERRADVDERRADITPQSFSPIAHMHDDPSRFSAVRQDQMRKGLRPYTSEDVGWFRASARAAAGSFTHTLRAMAQTGVEMGLMEQHYATRIEEWQKFNQHLATSQGASIMSWRGFGEHTAETMASFAPTLIVGALVPKAGIAMGVARTARGAKALTVATRIGSISTMYGRYHGDNVRFLREDGGWSPLQAFVAGSAQSLVQSIFQSYFASAPNLVQTNTRKMLLNYAKRYAGTAQGREMAQKIGRDHLLARITGQIGRPVETALRYQTMNLGGQYFAEASALLVDDYMKNLATGRPYQDFSVYLDMMVNMTPATLLLGMRASHVQARNRAIFDDLMKPLTGQENGQMLAMYDERIIANFDRNMQQLRSNLLNVQRGRQDSMTVQEVEAASDIIYGWALRSASKMDRVDGKPVDPSAFVEALGTAVARRDMTASELLEFSQMSGERQTQWLLKNGIIDAIDYVVKSEEADNAKEGRRILERENQIDMSDDAVARRRELLDERVNLALERAGLLVQEQRAGEPVRARIEITPSQLSDLVASDPMYKQGYDAVLDGMTDQQLADRLTEIRRNQGPEAARKFETAYQATMDQSEMPTIPQDQQAARAVMMLMPHMRPTLRAAGFDVKAGPNSEAVQQALEQMRQQFPVVDLSAEQIDVLYERFRDMRQELIDESKARVARGEEALTIEVDGEVMPVNKIPRFTKDHAKQWKDDLAKFNAERERARTTRADWRMREAKKQMAVDPMAVINQPILVEPDGVMATEVTSNPVYVEIDGDRYVSEINANGDVVLVRPVTRRPQRLYVPEIMSESDTLASEREALAEGVGDVVTAQQVADEAAQARATDAQAKGDLITTEQYRRELAVERENQQRASRPRAMTTPQSPRTLGDAAVDPQAPSGGQGRTVDAKALNGKPLLEALKSVVDDSEMGQVAKALSETGLNLFETAKIEYSPQRRRARGSSDAVYLGASSSARTLIHEAGHAMTHFAIKKHVGSIRKRGNKTGKQYAEALKAAKDAMDTPQPIRRLIDQYESTLRQLNKYDEYLGSGVPSEVKMWPFEIERVTYQGRGTRASIQGMTKGEIAPVIRVAKELGISHDVRGERGSNWFVTMSDADMQRITSHAKAMGYSGERKADFFLPSGTGRSSGGKASTAPDSTVRKGGDYGLANLDEFVAQAWSDAKFQSMLKGLKGDGQKSMWQSIVETVKSVLGINVKDSMLESVMDASLQIAEGRGVQPVERVDTRTIPAQPTLADLQSRINQAPTMEAKQQVLDAWRADPANAEAVRAIEGETRVDEMGVRQTKRMIDPNTVGLTEPETPNIRQSVDEYAERSRRGEVPPPVDIVFNEPTGKVVSSNRRRILAARKAGTLVPAWVDDRAAQELGLPSPLTLTPDGTLAGMGDGGVRAMTTPTSRIDAHYIPSHHVAVFYKGATAATIMHEFFHHMVAMDLLTPGQKAVFERAFGVGLVGEGQEGYREQERAEERAAEAFTRWLLEGNLDGVDAELHQSFKEIRGSFLHYADSTLARWELKPEVAQAFEDVINTPATTNQEQSYKGESLARAMEASLGGEDVTIGKTVEGKMFHVWKGMLTRGRVLTPKAKLKKGEKAERSEPLITEDQLRESLRRNGMKPYLKAADDPLGQQTSDMTREEAVAASAYMRDLAMNSDAMLANETAVQNATRRLNKKSLELDVLEASEQFAKMPRSPEVQGVGGLYRHALRGMRNAVTRNFTNPYNLFKHADGFQNTGFFQKVFGGYFRKMDRDYGAKRLELDTIWKKYINENGELVGNADAQYEINGHWFTKGQVIGLYLFSEGGNPDSRWMPTIYTTNKEVRPEVITEVKKIAEADADVMRFVKGWQEVSAKLLTELQQVAGRLGHRSPGSLGPWYLPFIQEDMTQRNMPEEVLLGLDASDSWGHEKGKRGMMPAQMKARHELSQAELDRRDASWSRRKGRLTLDVFDLTDRYQRSAANYISKAESVYRILSILDDARVEGQMLDIFGDGVLHGALQTAVSRHMFVSGRTSEMGMGERALRWIRTSTHGSLLPHNPVVVARQSGSYFQALAYIGHTPADAAKLFSTFMKGLMYKRGDSSLPRFYTQNALEGFEPHDRMVKWLPNTVYRYADAEIQDIKRRTKRLWKKNPGDSEAVTKTKQMIANYIDSGMRPIQWVDQALVTAVFDVAFDQKMGQLQAHIEAGEMTVREAQEASADYAHEIIIKSQPPTDVSERALGQTESELLKALLPFSGQRMKNFNAYIYDMVIPMFRDVQQTQGLAKIGKLGTTVWDHRRMLSMAAIMPALLFGLIARRRMPESWEEITMDLLAYPFGHIPIMGRYIEAAMRDQPANFAHATMYESVLHSVKTVTMDLLGKDASIHTAREALSVLNMVSGNPNYPMMVMWRWAETQYKGDKEGMDRFLRVMAWQVADREDWLNTFPKNIVEDTRRIFN